MRSGLCNKWVTCWQSPQTSPDTDGFWEALDPPGSWCQITPFTASAEGRTTQHLVSMRYHPQITVDSMLRYYDARLSRDRDLYVRGVQSVNEAGDEMRLLCEEVQP